MTDILKKKMNIYFPSRLISHYEAKLFKLPGVWAHFMYTLRKSHVVLAEMGITYIN